MREIRFKAKRLTDGIWVEGDLIHFSDSVCIGEHIKGHVNQIDPSTVCQYTGLKDKNGKEIWEHDLLKDSRTICEVICTKGCFSIKTQIGFVPFSTTIIDKEQLSFFTNIGSKFDRKEEK